MLYTLIVISVITHRADILERHIDIHHCSGAAAEAGVVYRDPMLPKELSDVRIYCLPEIAQIKRGY